jgi:hypothetical protein
MKATLITALALLALSPSARAEAPAFTFYTAPCEIDGRLVRLHGAACLSDHTARADLLDHAQSMGESCRRTLGRARAHSYQSGGEPRRADGCDPANL